MKLSLVIPLLLIAILQVGASTFGQTFTFKKTNLKIEQLFNELQRQTGYNIFYNESTVPVNTRINVAYDNTPLVSVLEDIGLSYRIVDKNIIVTRGNQSPNPESSKESIVQTRRITGQVVDEQGNPQQGVTVTEIGHENRTATDRNGEFSIVLKNANSSLRFSYLGYHDQEIKTGNTDDRTMVRLVPIVEEMEDIVVVGYGTQKKGNLTGAISSIKADQIVTTTHTSVAQQLSGKVPGLQIRQQTGEPGEFSNMINIRGFGTPLIVIDGIVREGTADFQKLNPRDIDNISVLKDASAAIYGLNAGNGVILVTTKKGAEGKPRFNFNYVLGTQTPTDMPKMLNAAQYMEMRNDADVNAGGEPFITKEELENWMQGGVGYESTDWYSETMKNRAVQEQYDFSIRGGAKVVDYFTSVGYKRDNGLMRSGDMNYHQYSVRSNLGVQLADNLKLEMMLTGRHDRKNSPGQNFWTIFRGTRISLPTDKVYANNNVEYPGDVSPGSLNPAILSDKNYSGYSLEENNNIQAIASLAYDLPFLENLQLKASISYNNNSSFDKNVFKAYTLYSYSGAKGDYIGNIIGAPSTISNSNSNHSNIITQTQLSYNGKIDGDHNLGATAVFETNQNFYRYSLLRREYEFYTNDQINLASLNNQQTDGYESETAFLSFIGRVNYDYKSKYLLEFAFRQDGTYRYHPDRRWGFFPVVSGGWRISEENLIKDNLPFISDLKIRGSYGQVGENAGEPFQHVLGFIASENKGYEFIDGNYTSAIGAPGIVNERLTWYTSTISNIGIDLNLFNGFISVEADVYQRFREGLLATRNLSLPNTFGGSLPQENLNSDKVQGFDFVIGHRNQIRDFRYNVSFNFNLARTKNVYVERGEYRSSWDKWKTGNTDRWNDIVWGFEQLGQFQNMEEIIHAPLQNGAEGNIKELPGDFILKDTNGDGVVDSDDVLPLFYGRTPTLFYGLNLNASYKRFDINVLLQGAGRNTMMFDGVYGEIFAYKGNSPEYFYDRWHKADPYDVDSEWIPGKWPAARFVENVGAMYRTMDVWRRNADFLRIKSVELGYTIPLRNITKLESVRVYANGFNLYTFADSFLKPFDPEKIEGFDGSTNGFTYPLTRSFNLGLNLAF